jgi:hypothetical protein
LRLTPTPLPHTCTCSAGQGFATLRVKELPGLGVFGAVQVLVAMIFRGRLLLPETRCSKVHGVLKKQQRALSMRRTQIYLDMEAREL